ncbi:hypothetical protein QIS99_27220 [Streptomyces sp. B-S-A8]|uniref:Lipoprotein n=1 Tax=Streptomyces solicavernae TaxID=3043614 RepID=A0ABT6RZI9_9ACTN|nr:hypothetical protein [Streptomyces sp. B-S-A8]MDI3389854.1 hypothetical protein [Streptomyces sp. B-S-A8]
MKLRSCRISLPVVTVAALLTVGGCGVGVGEKADKQQPAGVPLAPATNLTMQEAAERADAMLDATMSAIRPEVQWAHGYNSAGSCDVTRHRVVMTIISKERLGSFLGIVQRSWEKSGYEIKAVNKDKEFPALYAQSKDGFGIDLTIGAKRQASFRVSTPCVKKSEVSDPTTSPNGPSYKNVDPIPRPNVRSEFWSSDKPAK